VGGMTHLLPAENWPRADGPKQIAYICGVMKDADLIPDSSVIGFPKEQNDRVYASMKDYLTNNSLYLWPSLASAGDPAAFDWANLHAPEGTADTDRLPWQYWRANIDPSERYLLAVAGSTRHRLRADESGIANLVLTGDWIRNGFNTPGCIESAVLSGRQAARCVLATEPEFIGETDFPKN
jgi:hypothetical protein